MKRYWVTLTALAYVQTKADIYADSAEEAENKAIEEADNGDLLWEYDGIYDGDPEVCAVAMEVVDVK